MMSLKSAARRGGIASAAALSALALASCSAGQITQTSSQVTAVDGAFADSEDGTIAVRDVTVIVSDEGEAALKFTAVNQDPSMTEHTLESVEVDGTEVELQNNPPLGMNCSLVGHSEAGMDKVREFDNGCIEYTVTSLENQDYAIAGTAPVTFTFEHTTVEVLAAISGEQHPAGQVNREDMTDANTDNVPMFD